MTVNTVRYRPEVLTQILTGRLASRLFTMDWSSEVLNVMLTSPSKSMVLLFCLLIWRILNSNWLIPYNVSISTTTLKTLLVLKSLFHKNTKVSSYNDNTDIINLTLIIITIIDKKEEKIFISVHCCDFIYSIIYII